MLTIFDVKPDYDPNIMKQGQDLYDVTARVLTGMRMCLPSANRMWFLFMVTQRHLQQPPGCILSADSVGHVEAGLRTQHLQPLAEEMNRQITDALPRMILLQLRFLRRTCRRRRPTDRFLSPVTRLLMLSIW